MSSPLYRPLGWSGWPSIFRRCAARTNYPNKFSSRVFPPQSGAVQLNMHYSPRFLSFLCADALPDVPEEEDDEFPRGKVFINTRQEGSEPKMLIAGKTDSVRCVSVLFSVHMKSSHGAIKYICVRVNSHTALVLRAQSPVHHTYPSLWNGCDGAGM